MIFKGKLQCCFKALSRYSLSRVLIIFIACTPVIANALVDSDVYVTDVTPSSFTVVWIDEPNATGSIDLYSNVLGSLPVLDAVFQNQFTDSNSLPLANLARLNGVLRVRVSNLSANTPYFFKLNYTNLVSGVLPASGPLFAVKTLLNNAAVSNESITIDVLQPDGLTAARGAILLAQVDGSPYPVSHLVGDATADKTAVVNLSNLFTAGVNRELLGGEGLELVVLGGSQSRAQLNTVVPVNNKLGELEVIAPGTILLQSTIDSDGDGIPDWYESLHNLVSSDGDADDDTLTDLQEYQLGTDPNSQDSDGDGWTDDREINIEGTSATNADSDLDGIEDDEEALSNTDPLNGDSDGDGALDGDELTAGTAPDDASSIPVVDIDSDGAGDIAGDNCVGIPNADQADLDNDGIGDVCDDDIDGDAVLNTIDNAPINPNVDQADTDGDGIGDAGDNCSADYNPSQIDTDNDSLGNVCDPDDDNDGVADFAPIIPASDIPFKFTNIIGVASSTFDVIPNTNAAIGIYKYDPELPVPVDQQDVLVGIIEMENMQWTASILQGADLTDVRWLAIQMDVYNCNCFNTKDGDTFTLLADMGEIKVYPPVSIHAKFINLLNVADDGSTYSSSLIGIERLSLLVKSAKENIPLDNCRIDINSSQVDSDGDGIGDVCDLTAEDLDGDGVLNGADNCPDDYNPNQLDYDNDTLGNACDLDSDNDGVSDVDELLFNTNPLAQDTDGDGIIDGNEDFDFDGVINSIEISNGDNPVIAQGRYKKGLNYFHYPNSVPQNLTAYSLLANLGGEVNAISVQRINATTGLLEKAEYLTGVLQGIDFPVITGEGYLLDAAQDFTKNFTETLQCNGVNLTQGKNLIGFSCLPSNFGAYDLLEYLGGSTVVSSVQRFNTKTGLFETATYLSGSPVGVNFSITNIESYLVYSKQVIALPSPIDIPVFSVTSFTEGAVINGTSVTISGTVSNDNVRVTVNGVLADVTAGVFTVTLPLPVGAHTLTIVADNQGVISSQIMNITVQVPPVITIESHVDNQIVHQQSIVIFGSLDKPVASVTVNGITAKLLNGGTQFNLGFHCRTNGFGNNGCAYSYDNNTNEQRISLDTPQTTITVEATDFDGIVGSKEIVINQERLNILAVNPGDAFAKFNIVLTEEIAANTTYGKYEAEDTAAALSGAPSGMFFEPFDGTIYGSTIESEGKVLSVNIRLNTRNEAIGSHDMWVDYELKNAAADLLYQGRLLLRVDVSVSNVAPELDTTMFSGNDTVQYSSGPIDGEVSGSTARVKVNGIEAEVVDLLKDEGRYFIAPLVPLNIGSNTVIIEAFGEGYDLGDTSLVTTNELTVNVEKTYRRIHIDQQDDQFFIPKNVNPGPDKVALPLSYTENDVCTSRGCLDVDILDLNSNTRIVHRTTSLNFQGASYVESNSVDYIFRHNLDRTRVTGSGIYNDFITVRNGGIGGVNFKFPIEITVLESWDAPEIVLSSPVTVPDSPARIMVEITNDSAAVVTLNGVLATQDNPSDKHFYTVIVPLLEGDNTVDVVADGINGLQSMQTYTVNLTSIPPPTVTLVSHTDGQQIPDDPLNIIVDTTDSGRALTLFVNGNKVSSSRLSVAGNQYTWTNTRNTVPGVNQIQIFADEYYLPVIEFTLDVVVLPAPIINITSHVDGETVTQAPIRIEGNIQNAFEYLRINNRNADLNGNAFSIDHIDLVDGVNVINFVTRAPGQNGEYIEYDFTINYQSSELPTDVQVARGGSMDIVYEFTTTPALWAQVNSTQYTYINAPSTLYNYGDASIEKLSGNRIRLRLPFRVDKIILPGVYNFRVDADVSDLTVIFGTNYYDSVFIETFEVSLTVLEEEILFIDNSLFRTEFIQLTPEQDVNADYVELVQSELPVGMYFSSNATGQRHDEINNSWEVDYVVGAEPEALPDIYNYTVTYNFKTSGTGSAVYTEVINKSIDVRAVPVPLSIDITSHNDGDSVTENPITLSGTVTDSAATVTVNGVVATITQVGQMATFSVDVALMDGVNVILINVTDLQGGLFNSQITINKVDQPLADVVVTIGGTGFPAQHKIDMTSTQLQQAVNASINITPFVSGIDFLNFSVLSDSTGWNVSFYVSAITGVAPSVYDYTIQYTLFDSSSNVVLVAELPLTVEVAP